MMNDPFFRSYLNQQPSRPVSVQQTQRRSSPKVVSVPVHFVSSDQPQTTISMLKESAAIKIQRVFRGFLVRKSVKKIASIRNEVSEIERRINATEVVDLIRRDAKERLKVNETLMSLLFKLDSIRGVNCGVRDLRKAVTKKAIALQEKIDSIAQADHQTLDSTNNDSGEIDSPERDHSRNSEAVEDDEEIVVKEVVKEDHTSVNGGVELQKDDDKMNGELLEKLMDDNEKMMKLMMQVLERNEMQSRMINSLSRRVEQVEKTFVSTDKPRRRRKRHVA